MTWMGKTMQLWALAIPLLLTAVGCADTPTAEPGKEPAVPIPEAKEEWIQLFNGEDLTGWDVKIKGLPLNQDPWDTFRVEENKIVVSYDRYDRFEERFGHLFYHQPFGHYLLAVEYRFVGEQAPEAPEWAFRNSGVMLHSQPAASMGLDQDFPISIEVQFLGGDGTQPRSTANLCTPGTHVEIDGRLVTDHCLNSTSPTFHGDQWVRTEVLVRGGNEMQHLLDGQPVMIYQRPQIGGGVVSGFDPEEKRDGRLLEGGYIALQSESHPIEFRKVELLNLVGCMDREATNYRSYYREPDPEACRY